MTYDYRGSWSDPGSIAPSSWAKKELTLAETCVPSARIRMGILSYGRGWHGDQTTDQVYSFLSPIVNGRP